MHSSFAKFYNLIDTLEKEGSDIEIVINGDERKAFEEECSNEECARTLKRLIYSIIGTSPSDCNIIELLHYGNPSYGFPRGQSDYIALQGTYMLALLSYAMTVESAY